MRIKFIGHGDVVKTFLKEFDYLVRDHEVELYTRKNISKLEASDDFIFYCASANEKKILEEQGSNSRMAVAKENLKILKQIQGRGFFTKGHIFVLSNPSELLAEHIFKTSKNKEIYALGTYYDKVRYHKILKDVFAEAGPEEKDAFDIMGLHYLSPVPKLHKKDYLKKVSSYLKVNDQDELMNKLQLMFEQMVLQEFNGHKPPILSGSQNIAATLEAFYAKGEINLSGYCPQYRSFLSGALSTSSKTFSATLPENQYQERFILNMIQKHQRLIESLGQMGL